MKLNIASLFANRVPRRNESERPAGRAQAEPISGPCPKHPSIPAAFCACAIHKPVNTSLFTKIKPAVKAAVHRGRWGAPTGLPLGVAAESAKLTRAQNYQAEVTLVCDLGILTICGVCGDVAADHQTYHTSKERIAVLLTFIRTNRCKYCDEGMPPGRGEVECTSRKAPDGLCKRRYLPRSKKVAACEACANHISTDSRGESHVGTHIVEEAEFNQYPQMWVEVWRRSLTERGLMP